MNENETQSDETKMENIKANTKKAIKFALKNWKFTLIILLIIAVISIILAAASYLQVILDGTEDSSSSSNVQSAVSSYSSSLTVNEDGEISASSSIQELWDELVENGSNIEDYLDSAEELAKLVYAELITQNVDTRERPDDSINWTDVIDELTEGSYDEDEEDVLTGIQGIIKFKRAIIDTDDNSYESVTMSYVDYETFYKWIEEYEGGNTSVKEDLLKHFTLDVSTEVVSSSTDDSTEVDSDYDTSKLYFIGDSWIEGLATNVTSVEDYCYGETGKSASDYLDGDSLISELTTDINDKIDEISAFVLYLGVNDTSTSAYMNSLIDILISKYELPVYVIAVNHVSADYTYTGSSETIDADTMNANIDSYNNTVERHCKVTSGAYYIDASLDLVDDDGYLITTDTEGLHLSTISAYQTWYNNIISGIGENVNITTTIEPYAIVATWNETEHVESTEDPERQEEAEENYSYTYSVTTKKVDYQSLTSGYTMPFNYLWEYLVVSKDKDFVLELADLVYDSEIEITICDNETVNEETQTIKYTVQRETYTTIDNIHYKYDIVISSSTYPRDDVDVEPSDPAYTVKADESYTYTYYTKTTTNTLNVKLTKADVWMADYEYEEDDIDVADSNYEDDPDEFTDMDPSDEVIVDGEVNYDENFEYGLSNIEKIIEDAKSTFRSKADVIANDLLEEYNNTVSSTPGGTTATNYDITNIETTIEGVEHTYTETYINKQTHTKVMVQTHKISWPSDRTVTAKIDKDSTEPNFVTIFIKYQSARSNILELYSWFIEIVEANDDTIDLVDLSKYLIYVSTGEDYGVTEIDFESLVSKKYSSTSGGTSGLSGNKGIIFDYLLELGFSPEGCAGVVANMYKESGCQPNNLENSSNSQSGVDDETFTTYVNDGTVSEAEFSSSSKYGVYSDGRYGYGLCQWTSVGRKKNLYDFAEEYDYEDGEFDISDIYMQVDFFVYELEHSYSSIWDDIYNATDPYTAGYIYCYYYEVPANTASTADTRGNLAEEYYQEYLENGTSGEDTDISASASLVVEQCYIEPATPSGYCAKWVNNVYENATGKRTSGNANDLYSNICTSSDESELKAGMIIASGPHTDELGYYRSGSGSSTYYGHVGIYVGNGKVMHSTGGEVLTTDLDSWISSYTVKCTCCGSIREVRWGYPSWVS